MNYSATVLATKERVESRWADFLELTKPRISVMVLFTVAAAAFAAGQPTGSLWTILHVVLATGLVAASASIANQFLEIASDAKMQRTSDRPLPAGRVRATEALSLALATVVMGELYLAWTCGRNAAMLGAATWLLYVAVYTPLKKYSVWNTLVGAIPGAMPVLIGWSATETPLSLHIVSMFTLLLLWQLPHFMAIAWLYRRDYELGGFKMLTVTDRSGLWASRLAVVVSAALIPVSLLPPGAFRSPLYVLAILMLSVVQLWPALRFWRQRNDQTARRLLRASLIYLPAMLALMVALHQLTP